LTRTARDIDEDNAVVEFDQTLPTGAPARDLRLGATTLLAEVERSETVR
jgi:hypothetical protein